MVQIVHIRQPQSIGAALGEGFNQGVSKGLEDQSYEKRLGMHAKLTDMMQQQKQTREGKAFLEAMGPDMLKAYGMDAEAIDKYAPLGQGMLAALMQMKSEMSDTSNLRSLMSGGTPGQLGGQTGFQDNAQQPQNEFQLPDQINTRTPQPNSNYQQPSRLEQGSISQRNAQLDAAEQSYKRGLPYLRSKESRKEWEENYKQKRENIIKQFEPEVGLEQDKLKKADESTVKDYEETRKGSAAAQEMSQILDQMDTLLESGYLGPMHGYEGLRGQAFGQPIVGGLVGSGINSIIERVSKGRYNFMSDEERAARAGMKHLQVRSLELLKGPLAKGITASEFPQFMERVVDPDKPYADNKSQIKEMRAGLQRVLKKQELYDSVTLKDGSLPRNASKIVEKKLATWDKSQHRQRQEEARSARKKQAFGVTKESGEPEAKKTLSDNVKVAETHEKPPKASDYPPGTPMRSGKSLYISDGEKWVKQ